MYTLESLSVIAFAKGDKWLVNKTTTAPKNKIT
jgi:hypothetical protein